MPEITQQEKTALLRRANCCFADLAYSSLKPFNIGNFKKGLCEFRKAESLFHYINALGCENGCADPTVTLCFSEVDFDVNINNYFMQIGNYSTFTVIGGSNTPDTIVTNFTNYFGSIFGEGVVSVTYSDGCFTFTGPCGDTSFNGLMVSLRIEQTGLGVSELEEGPFASAEELHNKCLSSDQEIVFLERIRNLCGCCGCPNELEDINDDTL